MEPKYICINEEFYLAKEQNLHHRNRAFAYGDGIFETIHCLGTTPQFLANHFARLSQGMKALKMNFEDVLSAAILARYIEKLLNKNRIFKGARIRLSVFREAEGLYTPGNDKISWLMESTPLAVEQYELNSSGLHVDIFDQVHKPVNLLSNLKTTNALIYVLAGIYKRDQELDECFILNQFGRIAETISSNIFIYRDEVLITPPLTEGCVAGTMRYTIINLARNLGYRVEEKPFLEKYLFEAEEVFITNAIQGVKWIGAYKDKRYFNFVARKLIAGLNQLAFKN